MLRKNVFWKILFVIPIVVLIVLRNYSYYWDGVDIAYYLNNPTHPKMFHQHHLLFAPFCYSLFYIVTKLGIVIKSLDFLILLNIISGIVFLIIVYISLNTLFPQSPFSGAIGVLITGVSYIFGTYLRNSDQYIIPLTICSLIILRIIRHFRATSTLKITYVDWILLFFAIMLHQMALFMIPALIYVEWQMMGKAGFKKVIFHVLILILGLSLSYVLIYFLANPSQSFSSFWEWAIGYGKKEFWVFKEDYPGVPIINLSVAESILSNKALFIAPIERYSVLRLHEFNLVYGNSLVGEICGWFLYVIVLAFILFGFYRMFSEVLTRKIAIFLVIWILPLLAFMQIFVPYACFYRMFYLFPLIIFIVACINSCIKSRRGIIAGVVILFVYMYTNFIYGFIPESIPSNNPYLMFAQYVKENSTKRDLFIMPVDDYFYSKYLRYFGDRDILKDKYFKLNYFRETSVEEVKEITNNTREWIINRYDNIYIYRVTSVPRNGYLMMIPLFHRSDTPEYLVLNLNQIKYTGQIDFFDMTFHKMEVSINY